MGENDTSASIGNEPLPLYDKHLDPLLRMQFNDPLAAIRSTRKAVTEKAAMPPPPNKRPKLSRSSSVSSSSSSSAAPPPKPKMKSPLLHQTCRLFPRCAPVVESALEMEPQAATKRAEKGNKSSYIVGDARVPYSLPMNILLHQNASPDVLRILAQAAPEALAMKDGRDECSSLGIALRLHGHSTRKQEDEKGDPANRSNAAPKETIPEQVLNANPAAAQLPDRRHNFPLHTAAYVGASFDLVHKLFFAFPEALLETNWSGETPLDICIRNGKCSDHSTAFLQEKTHHLESARLRNRVATMPIGRDWQDATSIV